jgi:type IV secretion system protein VirB4
MYLFRQIEKRLQGQPSLLVIDEAWLALGNPIFADRIKEWLKVFRKANCAVVLATQELSDVVRSEIRDSVLDACPTRIVLPNPAAGTESMMPLYTNYLNLNEQQMRIIAESVKKRDYYYTAKMMGNRLFSLGLGPVAMSFLGASGKEDLKAIQKLNEEHGKEWPYHWLLTRGLENWAEAWLKLYRTEKAA